ncbi:MAG TPA: hypothetical protein VF163_22025 [Micromonosporaceae bacterium]
MKKQVSGRSLGWAIAIGFVIDIIGIGIQAWRDLQGDEGPPWIRNVFIGVGALLAIGKVGLDLSRVRADASAPAATPVPGGYPGTYPTGPGYPPGGSAKAGRRTVSAVAAVVLVLALCGIGGVAASWAAGQITKLAVPEAPWEADQRASLAPGADRLAEPVSQTTGTLTVDVTKVEVNDLTTRVTVHARSDSDEIVRLLRAQLVVPGANTLAMDVFASNDLELSAHGETTGTLVFVGAVAADVPSVTLAFTSIFGGFDDPTSMDIGVPLTTG